MNRGRYFKFTLVGEGSYIQPIEDLMSVLDAEFDCFKSGYVGDKMNVELEIIEMTDEEYNKLPEFQGW